MRLFKISHKFKENSDSCLPLVNIIGELLCLTLPALFALAFSTPAQSYFIFPYLHFQSLHIYTCFFRTCIFHPCTVVLDFPYLIIPPPPPRYLIFPYLHFHTPQQNITNWLQNVFSKKIVYNFAGPENNFVGLKTTPLIGSDSSAIVNRLKFSR